MTEKKKKAIFVFLFVFLFFLLPASAEKAPFSADEINRLIPGELEGKIDPFSSEVSAEIDFSSLLSCLRDEVLCGLPDVIPFFEILFAFLVCSAVLSALKESLLSESLSSLLETVFSLALSLLIGGKLALLLGNCLGFLKKMTLFVSSLLPYLSLLSLSGGNAVTAAGDNAFLLFTLSAVQNLCIGLLSPLIRVSLAFSLSDSISDNVNLAGIPRLFKKIYSFFLTTSTGLLSILLFFQHNLSLAADNAAAKSIKFAGSLIPVVGSSLGDAVRTVISSLSVIRTSLGIFGLLVILLLLLPCAVSLFLYKFALSAACTLSGLFGMKREERTLSLFADIIDMMIASVIASSVIFIVSLALFVSSTSAAV